MIKEVFKTEAKTASIYVATTFFTKVLGFLLIPLFWKKLDPIDYGIIAVVDMIGNFLQSFWGLSLESGLTRFYYEWDEQDRDAKMVFLWILNLMSIVFIGYIFILFSENLFQWLFKDVSYNFIFLGLISYILSSTSTYVKHTIRIVQKAKLFLIHNIVSFLITTLLSIYFVLIIDLGLHGYFYSLLLSSFFVFIINFFIMLYFGKPKIISKNELYCILKYSIPLIPSAIIAVFNSLIERFAIQYFLSMELLGIYSICQRFLSLINLLHTSLKNSYVPSMMKIAKDIEKDVNTVSKKLRSLGLLYMMPVILASIMIGVFIKDLLVIINNQNYFSIHYYLPYMVIPSLLQNINLYTSPGIIIKKKTNLILLPTFLNLAFSMLGAFVLIKFFDLYGLIVSQFLSAFLYFYLFHYFSEKCLEVNPLKKILVVILLSAIVILLSNVMNLNLLYSISFKALLVAALFYFIIKIFFQNYNQYE